jgi:dTDP-4-dehydrorhamnose 3,5-epimerase
MDGNIKSYSIKDLLQISLPVNEDERGFFKEVLRVSKLEQAIGKEFVVKQVNHSQSVKNTLRGIHVAPWNKIIYVVNGKVQVVVVDCRQDSPTFGQHESIILGDDNRSCVLIPTNCGNSYLVLSEAADYVYLTDREWAPNLEKDVAWNDKTLAIDWQLEGEPFLSERDKNSQPFYSVFPKS